MAYDEHLTDRIRDVLSQRDVVWEEKRMMGGLCFMADGKMCLGIVGERLMARVGPEAYAGALQRTGASEMDFTGRPMKGFVFVSPEALDLEEDFEGWVDLCLAYNPSANRSR